MLLTLLRIFLSVDMALGLLNYAAWTWLAGQPFNLWFLCLSIFSAHLPDADMIPYLLFRKRYRLTSHWIFGHHPLLVLPLIALGTFAAAKIWMPHAVGYIVGMVTTGVFLHFTHDGMHKYGFPWLSPFAFTRFRFRDAKFRAVPQSEIDTWRGRTVHWQQQRPSAFNEISGRTAPINRAGFLLWFAGAIALIALILFDAH